MARRVQRFRNDEEKEDEIDQSQAESQQTMMTAHRVKQAKSDDKKTQLLATRIHVNRNSLQERFAERLQGAQSQEQNFRGEFTSAILDALRPPVVSGNGVSTVMIGTHIAENGNQTSTTAVLNHAHCLIRNYARLDDVISAFQSEQAASVANSWCQENEQAGKQLRLGAKVARRKVQEVLGACTNGLGEMAHAGDVEVLPSEEATGLSYNLQSSLRYAERGIQRMAKAVPFEKS